MARVLGVEVGGMHTVLAVSVEGDRLDAAERKEIPTTTPQETLALVKDFISSPERSFSAVGIACFGPLDLNPQSPTYGHITTTPKKGWADVDFVGAVFAALRSRGRASLPVAFDTDVNAPAFAEALMLRKREGIADHGAPSVCYITVGTGVGVGAFVGGCRLHGALHPEGGHIPCEQHPYDAQRGYSGACPYHGRCVEGMLATSALAARVGLQSRDLKGLPDDHFLWDIAAHYAAHLCAYLTLLLSPHRIVLGGGLFQRKVLFPLVRTKLAALLNGYIRVAEVRDMDTYISESSFGPNAGLAGAFAMAREALEPDRNQ
eukprot:Opistho-2@67065